MGFTFARALVASRLTIEVPALTPCDELVPMKGVSMDALGPMPSLSNRSYHIA